MSVREGVPQPQPPPPVEHKMPPVNGPGPYSGEKVRGGEIILRTPARCIIFIAGLTGIFVLVLLLRMFA
jgi:hypothetical protein